MNDTPTAAPMREDVTQADALKWRERWYGSEPQKGSAIVDERGNVIAYFGGDKATHKATTATVSAHNAALAHTAGPDAGDGYATAFYEIATMLGIGAQAASPADVWRDQMRPKLEALTGNPVDAVRPSDETLDGFLPESLRGEKRCGIQRSDWMTGWYVGWSPRNDNENAEGPWSHWVALAHEILKADAKAIAAATPAKKTGRFDPPGLWESEPRSSADDAGKVNS